MFFHFRAKLYHLLLHKTFKVLRRTASAPSALIMRSPNMIMHEAKLSPKLFSSFRMVSCALCARYGTEKSPDRTRRLDKLVIIESATHSELAKPSMAQHTITYEATHTIMKATQKQKIRSLDRALDAVYEAITIDEEVKLLNLGDLLRQSRKWSKLAETQDLECAFRCETPNTSFGVDISIYTSKDEVFVDIELLFTHLYDEEIDVQDWMESKWVKAIVNDLFVNKVEKCFPHKWTVDTSVLASWDH